MYPSHPAANIRSRSPFMAKAVSAITLMWLVTGSALRIRVASRPSMDSRVQGFQSFFQVILVLCPGDTVHARGGLLLQGEEAVPQRINGHVVQQCGEPCTFVVPCRFSHALQSGRPACPAQRPERGRLRRVPLGWSPSLHHLRRQVFPAFVRRLPRYYGTIRLPRDVHVGLMASSPPRPSIPTIRGRSPWDLPVPVHGVSARAQGLRPRGTLERLAHNVVLGVAFRFTEQRRRPGHAYLAAQWLARAYPCQRFAVSLAVNAAVI